MPIDSGAGPTDTGEPTDTLDPPRRGRLSSLTRLTGGLLLTVALLTWGLPRAVDASWSQIARIVLAAPAWQLAALGGLWLAGLVANAVTLAAALPGLGPRRALTVNLTGACVANTMPFGGAAGTATNWAMVRRWGFTGGEFTRYAVVTNLWDTFAKLPLPVVAVAWLGATGGGALLWTAGWSLVLLVVVLAVAGALLGSDRFAHRAGYATGRCLARLGRRRVEPAAWARRAGALRWETAGLVSSAWRTMTVSKLTFVVLQVLLLAGCLAAVGAPADPAVVFAAFAVQQVLSIAALTPGAAGVVEVGMAGVLVALGVPAPEAAAGVLVFRAYTFALTVPVGGTLLAWWLARGPGRPAYAPRRVGSAGRRACAPRRVAGAGPQAYALRRVASTGAGGRSHRFL